jgi:hypothetical protein
MKTRRLTRIRMPNLLPGRAVIASYRSASWVDVPRRTSREFRDQFEDLVRRLGAWAPPEAVRVQAAGSIRRSVFALTVVSLILMAAAFFIQNPVIAIPCCVGEIIVLTLSLYTILRGFVEHNLKRRLISLVMFVTALLMYRVYSLWRNS